MTLTTISIIIATAIFVAYNAISLANFGVPKSLSMTYYLWGEKANKGWFYYDKEADVRKPLTQPLTWL
jgi:hypothetical protein